MIVLLSGVSGSGKTSVCKLVVRSAIASGFGVGGIVCGAVFRQGRKVGIECSDLDASTARPPWTLAGSREGWTGSQPSATASAPGAPRNPGFDDSDAAILRYGMWEFSKQALEAADQTILEYVTGFDNAIQDSTMDRAPALVFVDEIGPLELDRGTGLVKTLAMLDDIARRHENGLNFLVVARPDIAARLMNRWPDSILVEMNGTSYPETAEFILAAFDRAASGSH